MINSPGSSRLSRSGFRGFLQPTASCRVRWKSVIGMLRLPAGPATSTRASNAAKATAGSDGCTTTQSSVHPKMACLS